MQPLQRAPSVCAQLRRVKTITLTVSAAERSTQPLPCRLRVISVMKRSRTLAPNRYAHSLRPAQRGKLAPYRTGPRPNRSKKAIGTALGLTAASTARAFTDAALPATRVVWIATIDRFSASGALISIKLKAAVSTHKPLVVSVNCLDVN